MRYLWLAAILAVAACQSLPKKEAADNLVRVGPGHMAYVSEGKNETRN